MSLSPLALALVLVLFGAAADPPRLEEDPRLVTMAAYERLKIPVPKVGIAIDSWRKEVVFSSHADGRRLLRAVPDSKMCPRREQRGKQVVLFCDVGALEAKATSQGGATSVELMLLRGMPRDDPQAQGVAWHYPPEVALLGGRCPGTSPEGRAECLLAQGQIAQAQGLLESLLGSTTPAFAGLRLGDIALAGGDVLGALAFYSATSTRGLPGRIAKARICELAGCEDAAAAFDAKGLMEPIATEFELRFIRFRALRGQISEATEAMRNRALSDKEPRACSTWPSLCLGMIHLALTSDEIDAKEAGLELYFTAQAELGFPKDLRLVREAADAAAALGAPAFGANLLATLSGTVPPADLRQHLEHVVRLFESAGDEVRASVVRDYAKSRLGRAVGFSKPSTAGPSPPAPVLKPSFLERMAALMEESERDLNHADALTVVSRSRASVPMKMDGR